MIRAGIVSPDSPMLSRVGFWPYFGDLGRELATDDLVSGDSS